MPDMMLMQFQMFLIRSVTVYVISLLCTVYYLLYMLSLCGI